MSLTESWLQEASRETPWPEKPAGKAVMTMRCPIGEVKVVQDKSEAHHGADVLVFGDELRTMLGDWALQHAAASPR